MSRPYAGSLQCGQEWPRSFAGSRPYTMYQANLQVIDNNDYFVGDEIWDDCANKNSVGAVFVDGSAKFQIEGREDVCR